MRNFLITVAATCLFTPPACLFTPATAQTDREVNRQSQPASATEDHGKKALTVKGGTLLNSNPTPEEAKKMAEATNRQILEKQRHKH